MATEKFFGYSEGDISHEAEGIFKDADRHEMEKAPTKDDWYLTPAEVHTLLRALQKGTHN